MRLAELKTGTTPNKAGLATIDWFVPEDGRREPVREEDVLHLPRYVDAELFKLQPNYHQFLFCLEDRTWFGGTDEKPFLVRLNDNSFLGFLRKGSRGFYHDLIPEGLTKLAKQVGTRCQFDTPEKQTYARQGDIFAYPLPVTWRDIGEAYYTRHGTRLEVASGPLQIYGTRHMLTFGSYLTDTHLLGRDLALVAEGTVVAPDHKDVKLTGPHALFQTASLFNPVEAD